MKNSRTERTNCTSSPTQQSQDRRRRPRREARGGSLRGKLAGLHPAAARDRQRRLQLVPLPSRSEKWQRINEFIWDKLKKSKSWKKILKVPSPRCRPSISSSSSSRTARPASSPTSSTTSTSCAPSKATAATWKASIRANPVPHPPLSQRTGQSSRQPPRQ